MINDSVSYCITKILDCNNSVLDIKKKKKIVEMLEEIMFIVNNSLNEALKSNSDSVPSLVNDSISGIVDKIRKNIDIFVDRIKLCNIILRNKKYRKLLAFLGHMKASAAGKRIYVWTLDAKANIALYTLKAMLAEAQHDKVNVVDCQHMDIRLPLQEYFFVFDDLDFTEKDHTMKLIGDKLYDLVDNQLCGYSITPDRGILWEKQTKEATIRKLANLDVYIKKKGIKCFKVKLWSSEIEERMKDVIGDEKKKIRIEINEEINDKIKMINIDRYKKVADIRLKLDEEWYDLIEKFKKENKLDDDEMKRYKELSLKNNVSKEMVLESLNYSFFMQDHTETIYILKFTNKFTRSVSEEEEKKMISDTILSRISHTYSLSFLHDRETEDKIYSTNMTSKYDIDEDIINIYYTNPLAFVEGDTPYVDTDSISNWCRDENSVAWPFD